METVYVETSVISHATARPSSNIEIAALQHQARRWFAEVAPKCELLTSQFVIDEASRGNREAAGRRLELLANMRVFVPTLEVELVAQQILDRSLMPQDAHIDALHVACAAAGGAEYLLTQNCSHIANAHTLPRIYELLDALEFPRLLICTPAEFLGDTSNGNEPHPR